MEIRTTNEGNDTTTHAGVAEARIAQPVDPMIRVHPPTADNNQETSIAPEEMIIWTLGQQAKLNTAIIRQNQKNIYTS